MRHANPFLVCGEYRFCAPAAPQTVLSKYGEGAQHTARNYRLVEHFSCPSGTEQERLYKVVLLTRNFTREELKRELRANSMHFPQNPWALAALGLREDFGMKQVVCLSHMFTVQFREYGLTLHNPRGDEPFLHTEWVNTASLCRDVLYLVEYFEDRPAK